MTGCIHSGGNRTAGSPVYEANQSGPQEMVKNGCCQMKSARKRKADMTNGAGLHGGERKKPELKGNKKAILKRNGEKFFEEFKTQTWFRPNRAVRLVNIKSPSLEDTKANSGK